MKKLRYGKIVLGAMVSLGNMTNFLAVHSMAFAEEITGAEAPFVEDSFGSLVRAQNGVENEAEQMSQTDNEVEQETDSAENQAEPEAPTDEQGESEELTVVTEDDEGNRQLNIVIKSFNPGYSRPEVVGEYFELARLKQQPILLAGLTVVYETSGGTEYPFYTFSEGSEMVGESFLFRLRGEEVAADVIYTRNMSATAGRLSLKYGGEVLDTVCWGLDEVGCISERFVDGKTLVRSITDEEIGDFEMISGYIPPEYDLENPNLIVIEQPEEIVEPKCRAVELSEIFTYFETVNTEQFIELFNRSDEEAEVGGCAIRYKNRVYALEGNIPANGFMTVYPASAWGLQMTKNPTSSNLVELIDVDGEVVDRQVYTSGQRKGMSLAAFGYRSDGGEVWAQTYNITPNAENVLQEYKSCPAGKVINLATGNCVNDTTIQTTLAACPEGKYRNPLTGRCKSYAATASATLKPCAEGYERNPETGRCRKIVTNDGADYALKTETYEEKREFVAIWAIVVVILAGISYIIFQYREEIKEKLHRK